ESMSQRKLCHVDKVDGKIAVKEGPIVHIALNMVPTDPFWRSVMERPRKLTELEGFDDEKKGTNDAGDACTNDQEVDHGDEGK
ncbi:MAG: hypothetical protein KKC03_13205, partial [Bacteroidetes bacterium]|nr:hypothetical protein [Bacteroidota bacterium]